ncbi:hypothetical protein CLV59_10718 [Chitinophaga dinghuensis]|uniref:Uncharacterized protein n=1 Tax=Chitinophaga dinghuensis TaxID=1539050 RepID=A0A327VQ67_9BACT|nr:hypothetical protein [Chitinophaga dinghuensis]RAJ77253.1 hypothetical protein CLV59_10718 [Chitinophaga dinghuensis]
MLNLIPPDNTPWILSEEYIKSVDFSYIETYSFNRLNPILTAEYDELFKRGRHGRLSVFDTKRLEELGSIFNGLELLIDESGSFHHSCERVSTFQADDPEVLHLKQILQMEMVECMNFLCAPYYRDAVVFYNSSGKIISTLNVCLSCKHMTTGTKRLKADFEVYDLLKKFFLANGHRVEDPHAYLMDQLGDQKAKFLADRDAKLNITKR